MLEARAMLALPGWLGLMMVTSKMEPGHPIVVLPMVGYVFALLPIRWFPVLFPCQLALVGGSLFWVPRVAGRVNWLLVLFLALAWLLNAGLYLLDRKERQGAPPLPAEFWGTGEGEVPEPSPVLNEDDPPGELSTRSESEQASRR